PPDTHDGREAGNGDRGEARQRWVKLIIKHDKDDLDEHRWVLLAARKKKELKPKDEAPDEVPAEQAKRVKAEEVKRIKTALEQAKNSEDRIQCKALCTDIIDLYKHKDDEAIKQ